MFVYFLIAIVFVVIVVIIINPMEVEESIDYLQRKITISPKADINIWKNLIIHTNEEKKYNTWKLNIGYQKTKDDDHFWIKIKIYYGRDNRYTSKTDETQFQIYNDSKLFKLGKGYMSNLFNFCTDITYYMSYSDFEKIASSDNILFKLYKYDDTTNHVDLDSRKIHSYLKKFYNKIQSKKNRIEIVTKKK